MASYMQGEYTQLLVAMLSYGLAAAPIVMLIFVSILSWLDTNDPYCRCGASRTVPHDYDHSCAVHTDLYGEDITENFNQPEQEQKK